MARVIGIGQQDFADIRREGTFYIDKTHFIQEWWENRDSVTLITRPRRFGKTLTMSMVEKFFSVNCSGRADLFRGLSIWQEESYRQIQGTYPVISLSFANLKEPDYQTTRRKICQLLVNLYVENSFLLESDVLTDKDREFFNSITIDMGDAEATLAIYQLCNYLYRYYGKKVIILLDEYDTPMQEAYVDGYWEELAAFTRSVFNAAFKTNPWLERAIMTGITRVSKESIFSDLNNLVIVTTTSDIYADSFGFTEQEVFEALDEYGFFDRKQDVKDWYDGFAFGQKKDIYNPWSILNFLKTGKLAAYWANTSTNSLAGKLIRESGRGIKQAFEELMRGGTLCTVIDEQIVYDQLDNNENAIWSLLLVSGYLKVRKYEIVESGYDEGTERYELELTNYEVKRMFQSMIHGWFQPAGSDYNDFVKALLLGDLKAMNAYMNDVALSVFSYFDTGKKASGAEPERLPSVKATTTSLKEPNSSVCFYHGFVLGLMVELTGKYRITSNRESGFGRYDVMLEPLEDNLDAMIMEFKVRDTEDEVSLEDTVCAALRQIKERKYAQELLKKGIPESKIRSYGVAFQGKKVLIGAE